MALPLSRSTTYANGTPVEAADLNDLQDAIVAGEHGEKVLALPGILAISEAGSPTSDWYGWTFGATSQGVALPIAVHSGDRLTSASVWVNEGSGNPLTASLWRVSTTGSTTFIASASSGGGGGNEEIVIDPGPYTALVNQQIVLRIAGSTTSIGTGQIFRFAELTYDRP